MNNFISQKEKELEEKFDWKECGDFKPTDGIVRNCYRCGFLTEFCDNCKRDHHTENRDVAIKSFLRQALLDYQKQVREMVERRAEYHSLHPREYNAEDVFTDILNDELLK